MNESSSITDILRRRPPMQFSAIAESAALRKACEAVLARWPDKARNKSPEDAEKILRRIYQFIQGWRQSWHTEDLRMGDIRRGAIYAFDEETAYPNIEKPVFDEIREFLLKELKYNSAVNFVSAMAVSYLENYAPSRPCIKQLGEALAMAISRIEARGAMWKWQKFFRLFPQVLSAENCAPQIADRLAEEENPRRALREECGLRISDNANIMRYISAAYIQRMRPKLEDIAAVHAVLNWLSPDGSKEKAQQTDAGFALEALLAPWLRKEPSDDIKTLLLERLIKLYGDPRLTKGGAWAQVGETYKNLLIRWLTGENMLFFLQVVSQVEDSHMWEPRRKFWMGLYEAGIISSAWVGFSEKARITAMWLKNIKPRRDFGLQTAGGSRADTSILVMDIGETIVVEGSHNYKVQIFKKDSLSVPRLYASKYDCEEIRLSCPDQIVHAPSVWRQNVLSRLWHYNRNNALAAKIEDFTAKLNR